MGYRSDSTPFFVSVTPSDDSDVTAPTRLSTPEKCLGFRALYIGVSGDVVVPNSDGTDVTFYSVPVGFLPVQGLRVKSTGTTASGIVAMF